MPTRNAPPRAPDPLAAPEGEDRVARERPQVLLGPEHGAAERVVAERRAVDQVLGEHRRLVLRARDLLDHDAALAVELLGVDLRAPDEVGQQVDRLGGDLGAAGDVEGDEVVRRVRVQHRAHRLGGLVDLAVVVVLLAALEDQMLQEMGHPVLFGALGARARVEGHEHRRGARRQLHAVQRKAVRQGGGLDARHENERTRARDCREPCVLSEPRLVPSRRRRMAATERHLRRRRHRDDPHRPCRAAPARHRRGGLLQRRREALQRDRRRARRHHASTSTRASSSSSSASPAPASRRR